MSGLEWFGRILVFLGIFIVLSGLLFIFWNKIPFLGKLPGDIVIHRGESTVFVPLATSIVLSVILTIVLNVVFRLFR